MDWVFNGLISFELSSDILKILKCKVRILLKIEGPYLVLEIHHTCHFKFFKIGTEIYISIIL